MTTQQELINYIEEQLKAGFGLEDVKKSLLETGWNEKSIDEAYVKLSAPPARQGEEDILEGFSPPPPYKRAVKRFVILFIGAVAVTPLIYTFMR
jgi:hypothetical protein